LYRVPEVLISRKSKICSLPDSNAISMNIVQSTELAHPVSDTSQDDLKSNSYVTLPAIFYMIISLPVNVSEPAAMIDDRSAPTRLGRGGTCTAIKGTAMMCNISWSLTRLTGHGNDPSLLILRCSCLTSRQRSSRPAPSVVQVTKRNPRRSAVVGKYSPRVDQEPIESSLPSHGP
jgi:hypothetical protein